MEKFMKNVHAIYQAKQLDFNPKLLQKSLDTLNANNVVDIICSYQMHNNLTISAALATATKLYFERAHRQSFYLDAYKLVCKIASNKDFSKKEAELMLLGFTNLYNLKTETLSWSSDFYNFDVLISNMMKFTLESALQKVVRKPNYNWFTNSAVITDRPCRVEETKYVKVIVPEDEIKSILYEKIMSTYGCSPRKHEKVYA